MLIAFCIPILYVCLHIPMLHMVKKVLLAKDSDRFSASSQESDINEHTYIHAYMRKSQTRTNNR